MSSNLRSSMARKGHAQPRVESLARGASIVVPFVRHSSEFVSNERDVFGRNVHPSKADFESSHSSTPGLRFVATAVASYSVLPEPMLARCGRLPTSGDFSFEVKWDGFRAIVSTEGALRVWSSAAVDVRGPSR
jgi:hypothetical protein